MGRAVKRTEHGGVYCGADEPEQHETVAKTIAEEREKNAEGEQVAIGRA